MSPSAEYMAGAYSKQSRPIDVSFIRECLSASEKLFGNPEICRVMDEFEKRFGMQSCFNSVSKLQKIVEKTEQMWQRTLVFQAIEYARRHIPKQQVHQGVPDGWYQGQW